MQKKKRRRAAVIVSALLLAGILLVTILADKLLTGTIATDSDAMEGGDGMATEEGFDPETDFSPAPTTETDTPADTPEPTAETGSISGFLWADTSDQPLADYTVQLYAADDLETPLDSTASDKYGAYIFENLTPDTYVLSLAAEDDLELPSEITKQNKFAVDPLRGDPDIAYTEMIGLGEGQDATGINAVLQSGFAPAAAITFANLKNAKVNDTVSIDGFTWVVVKTQTVGTAPNAITCVYLIMRGYVYSNLEFGTASTTTNYDTSLIRGRMKKVLDDKVLPTIQSIAVKPNLGNHTVATSPIAAGGSVVVMAGTQTQDILFAPSHKDMLDWVGGSTTIPSGHPLHSSGSFPRRFYGRTAASGGNVWGVNVSANSLDGGIHYLAMYAADIPAVWVNANAIDRNVNVYYMDTLGNPIGPTPNPATYTVTIGSAFSLTSQQIPGITEYSYVHWKKGVSGAQQSIANLPSLTKEEVTAGTDIYLVYEHDTVEGAYKITYKANNGKGEADYIQSAMVVGPTTLNAVTQATAKFTGTTVRPVFKGWNTEANGNGVSYNPGDPVALYGDLTLFAQWKTLRYYVTKDSDPDNILATYHELQNAVNYIRDNGAAGQPYTITATEHDNDVIMTDHENAVRFWANLRITLRSDSNGPYTLYQPIKRRHFDVIGELTLENIVLDVTNNGGGIFVRNILNIKDGAVIQNCANDQALGAAVYLYKDLTTSGVLNMHGGTIKNNASTGVGPVNGGGAVYVPTGTTFNMYGGTISGNSANTTNQNSGAGRGGAVYIDGGTFNLHKGTISGNAASTVGVGNGGAVYLQSGAMHMYGGTISNNAATTAVGYDGNGGGVYIANGGTFEMNGTGLIAHNKADDGGGVYAKGALTLNGGTISNCTATSRGGGVYAEGVLTLEEGIVITGNSVAGNGSGTDDIDGRGNGGGVHARGTFTMNGGTISHNTIANGASMRGGGVYVYSTSTEATINGGTISDNYAKYHGGGIFSYAPLTVTGSANITQNSALAGGGVYANGPFTMQGGEITKNFLVKAAYTTGGNGAGVFANDSSNNCFKMSAGIIAENKAETAPANWGGGVYGRIITVSGGTIEKNVAAVGGGIHGEEIVLSGSAVVKNNIATGIGTDPQSAAAAPYASTGKAKGGGVYAKNSLIVEENALITGNYLKSANNTTHYGGGIYALTSFELRGGTIVKNSSVCNGTTYGGGVFAGKDFKITGGTIGGQNAADGNNADYGGGLFANLGKEIHLDKAADLSKTAHGTMSAGVIQNNSATGDGGGLYVACTNSGSIRGAFTMTGGSITGNEAPNGDGGGIFTEDYDYADPATKYDNIGIAGATVNGNTSSLTYMPPSNATYFTNRGTRPFNGSFLDNDNINYHNPTPLTSNLIVSETVTGAYGDKTKAFEFTVAIKDKDGNLLGTGTSFQYEGGVLPGFGATKPADGTLYLVSGEDTFYLSHGQTITIKDLPSNCEIRIAETVDYNYYTAAFTDSAGASGTDDTGFRILGTDERHIDFVNDRMEVVLTGIAGDSWFVMALLLLSGLGLLAGMVAMERYRRKACRR
ncbi:MAG: hypothetical protein FWF10_02690 [Clostridiales bacterium]|nr:hypothetical protein [Clostridiales bacterium]